MTQLEITKYRLELALKLARESQGAYHHLSNMRYSDRHIGKFEDCQEDSCVSFKKTLIDIETFEEDYKRAFPKLYGKEGGV